MDLSMAPEVFLGAMRISISFVFSFVALSVLYQEAVVEI